MRYSRSRPVAALAAAAATALLAACGSGNSTTTPTQSASAQVTTTSTTTPAPTSSTSSSTSTTTTTTTTSTTSSTATTTASSTTTSTQTTRTETGPAFVSTNPTSEAAISHDLAAAIAVLAHDGYVPVSTDTYHSGDTLRVLIGAREIGGATVERAFFFDQNIYLGTDARTASARITVLDHSDTQVTLGYAVHPAGLRRVRFALDMGALGAIDPIPSAAARS